MNEALRKMCGVESDGKEQLALAVTAACGIAISSGILASVIYLLLALASMVMVRPSFTQSARVGAGVRLQSGIEKESSDGDLKVAKENYEKIAADKSAFSLSLQAKAQATLGTICGYWKTSRRPPRNDLRLVIAQMVMSS